MPLIPYYDVSPAGGAGASCVEAARESGFTGRLVLATREKHLPYDRPKLSKALDMSAEKLRLRTPDFYKVRISL